MADLEAAPVTDHQINELNKRIEISSNTTGNRYQLKLDKGNGEFERLRINFQHGPIQEVGANGFTDEALIAVAIDRIARWQKGPHACKENGHAIGALKSALDHLAARARRREAAQVEGTMGLAPGDKGYVPPAPPPAGKE